MRKLWLIPFLLVTLNAEAATKLRLHNTASDVAGYKSMDLQLGPAMTTSVTTETTDGQDIQWTKTAGGTALAWISDPILNAAASPIAGTITFNFYAKENATSDNSTLRPSLILYHGGSETATISNCGFATELTASIALKNWTTSSGGWTACSVTSTAIAAGDRIVLRAFINGCSGACTAQETGMGTGTVTVDYDGETDAADGSSWVQLTETVAFGSGTTPTLIGLTAGENARVAVDNLTDVDYKIPLPENIPAGSAIAVALMDGGVTATITVSDDQSNVYTAMPPCIIASSPNSSHARIAFAQNVAANTRMINVRWSSYTTLYGYAQVIVAAFANIQAGGAFDGCTVNSATNASITAGTGLSMGSTGDLVWQVTFNDDAVASTSFSPGSQSNITWKLGHSLLYDASASQWGVYSVSGALNPTMTRGNNQAWMSLAIALKAGSGGSSISGFHPIRIQHDAMPAAAANPFVVQLHASGNLIQLSSQTEQDHITGITSSPSLTWNSTGTYAESGSGQAVAQSYYAVNNTEQDITISITRSGTTGTGTYVWYDFENANASPFDVDSGGQTGDQATIVTSMTTCSSCISPTLTSNEVSIAHVDQDYCTASSITAPSGALFDAIVFTGMPVDGYSPVDQNGGYAHVYTTSTSALTFTWGYTCGTQPESYWAGRVATYKAPAASTNRKRVVIVE